MHHQYSASVSPFQAKTAGPLEAFGVSAASRHHGGGGVVLGRIDVAARPAHFRAEIQQRFDEHRGLDRHVERSGDPGAGERPVRRVALPNRHQTRHLVFCKFDFAPPEGDGFRGEIGDAMRNAPEQR